jgi:glycosyltransferase involved in cell wall biosynthesis
MKAATQALTVERASHPRLLVVHSSADLYGSDRSLLDFVRLGGGDMDIVVVLPETGPLVALLEQAGARVVVGEVCKVQRRMFSPKGFASAVQSLFRSVRTLWRLEQGKPFDLVYSNTVAIFGGAVYAKWRGRPHVWHIREIVDGSPRLTSVFRGVVAMLADSVLCNSHQTRQWIETERSAARCQVIWNGVAAAEPMGVRLAERARLDIAAHEVVFAMAGRINQWKGQGLLIEAFEQVCRTGADSARLLIVGSAYAGQEHFEVALSARIARSEFADRITWEPFRADVEAVWEAADVVVVPSTEPEPFGRVAIEAMAFSRPVIAAAHGGLVEIVEDGVTGLLFAPREAAALADAMRALVLDDGRRQEMGAKAQQRQREVFSVEAYAGQVAAALSKAVRPQRS